MLIPNIPPHFLILNLYCMGVFNYRHLVMDLRILLHTSGHLDNLGLFGKLQDVLDRQVFQYDTITC